MNNVKLFPATTTISVSLRTSFNRNGTAGEVEEAGQARRANEQTRMIRIRRKQPIFGDHVDNYSRKRGRGSSTVLQTPGDKR